MNDAQNQIATAQTQLAAHGYDPGVRHGQLDWSTRQSIRNFQGAKGLPVTGVVDGPTNTALHSSPGGTRGNRAGRPRGGIGGVGTGARPMPAIQHSAPASALPPDLGRPHHSSTHARVAQHNPSPGVSSMQPQYATMVSTGFRAPLLFSQSGIAAASTGNQVVAKPQMDFRGENLVIDPTSVGPNCSVS